MSRRVIALIASMTAAVALAIATIPTADKKGSKDSPLLKRYEGSFIVAYEQKAFAEFTLPLSRLEQIAGRTDRQHNRYFEPKNKKALEGSYTRLVYVIPAGRSPLEVLRNYQAEIKSQGGQILFECKGEACGGDPGKSSWGGGGDMSLAMYLYPGERITETPHTAGHCAMSERIKDQGYTAAEIPASGAFVSVLTYTMVSPGKHDSCKALNEMTIAVVDLLETKAREQKMVTISSGDMARAIASGGRVALYGIYFDFNKADVKPESNPTLEQMAKLLKENPTMKLLVVGHTDNVGSFPFNMDLSQRRAAAVVTALATRFAVVKERLTPVGVSFASPVAPNTTEEGRAKNRRVELVENSPASR
jgi:OOP family OmpA-OmpF porin